MGAGFGDDAEAQAALLLRHVVVAVQVEGLDGLQRSDLAEHVDQAGDLAALVGLAQGRGVKTLFREQDAAGFALEMEARLVEEGGQHGDVFGRDVGRVEVVGQALILPGIRIAQVARVGVVGDPPFKVALGTRHLGEEFEQVAHDVGAAAAALLRPVMGEGDEDAGMRIEQARGVMGEAGGAQVGLQVARERLGTHVGPGGGLVDLIVQDPIADARAVGLRPAFGHQMQGGAVEARAVFPGEVGDRVDASRLGFGMNEGAVRAAIRVAAVGHEQDGADNDVVLREQAQGGVVPLQGALVAEPGFALERPGLPARRRGVAQQGGDDDVHRRMAQPQRKQFVVGAVQRRHADAFLVRGAQARQLAPHGRAVGGRPGRGGQPATLVVGQSPAPERAVARGSVAAARQIEAETALGVGGDFCSGDGARCGAVRGCLWRQADQPRRTGAAAAEGEEFSTDVDRFDSRGEGTAQVGENGFGIGFAFGLQAFAVGGQALLLGGRFTQADAAQLQLGAGFAVEGKMEAHLRVTGRGFHLELAEVKHDRLPGLAERHLTHLGHRHVAALGAVAQHQAVEARRRKAVERQHRLPGRIVGTWHDGGPEVWMAIAEPDLEHRIRAGLEREVAVRAMGERDLGGGQQRGEEEKAERGGGHAGAGKRGAAGRPVSRRRWKFDRRACPVGRNMAGAGSSCEE